LTSSKTVHLFYYRNIINRQGDVCSQQGVRSQYSNRVPTTGVALASVTRKIRGVPYT